MKILTWKDQTLPEIINGPGVSLKDGAVLIICKQVYVKPPKINTGKWAVYYYGDVLTAPAYKGLFWKFSDAELFANAYAKRNEPIEGKIAEVEVASENIDGDNKMVFIKKVNGSFNVTVNKLERYEVLGMMEIYKNKILSKIREV